MSPDIACPVESPLGGMYMSGFHGHPSGKPANTRQFSMGVQTHKRARNLEIEFRLSNLYADKPNSFRTRPVEAFLCKAQQSYKSVDAVHCSNDSGGS